MEAQQIKKQLRSPCKIHNPRSKLNSCCCDLRAGVRTYRIHMTAENNFDEATVIETAVNQERVYGLLPGTNYLYVVYSVGAESGSHDGLNTVPSDLVKKQTGLLI